MVPGSALHRQRRRRLHRRRRAVTGVLQGSLLINVDSEVEGTFTIGSAGGADVDVTGRYAEEPTPAGLTGLHLQITGLQGGHSGIDIDRGRGNAIKLLARLLGSAQQEIGVRVASIEAGGRYNAIPREAAAVVAVPETEALRLTRWIETFAATVRQELARTEPDLQIAATPVEIPAAVMAPDAQSRVVGALYTCPNGVMRMSDSVPGLVETSTNLGLAAAADGTFTAGFLVAAPSTPPATTSNRWPAACSTWLGSKRCARTRSRAGNRIWTRLSSPSCSRSIATCGATTLRSRPCTPVLKRASSVPPIRDWI